MVSNFLLGFGGGIATAAIDNKRAQREADARNAEIVMTQQLKLANTIATESYKRDQETQTSSEVARIVREAGGDYSSPEVQSKIAAVPGGIKALRNLAETNKFSAEAASLGAINQNNKDIFGGGSTVPPAPSAPPVSAAPIADPLMPNFQDTVADTPFTDSAPSGGLVTPPVTASLPKGLTPKMVEIDQKIEQAAAAGNTKAIEILKTQREAEVSRAITSGEMPSPELLDTKGKSDLDREKKLNEAGMGIQQNLDKSRTIASYIKATPEYQNKFGELKIFGDAVGTAMGLDDLVSKGDVALAQAAKADIQKYYVAALKPLFGPQISNSDISTMVSLGADYSKEYDANLTLAASTIYDSKMNSDLYLLQKKWFQEKGTFDGVDEAMRAYVAAHPFVNPGAKLDHEKAFKDKGYGDKFYGSLNKAYIESDKSSIDDFLYYRPGDESVTSSDGNPVKLDWIIGVRKQPNNERLKETFIKKFGEDAYNKIQ